MYFSYLCTFEHLKTAELLWHHYEIMMRTTKRSDSIGLNVPQGLMNDLLSILRHAHVCGHTENSFLAFKVFLSKLVKHLMCACCSHPVQSICNQHPIWSRVVIPPFFQHLPLPLCVIWICSPDLFPFWLRHIKLQGEAIPTLDAFQCSYQATHSQAWF